MAAVRERAAVIRCPLDRLRPPASPCGAGDPGRDNDGGAPRGARVLHCQRKTARRGGWRAVSFRLSLPARKDGAPGRWRRAASHLDGYCAAGGNTAMQRYPPAFPVGNVAFRVMDYASRGRPAHPQNIAASDLVPFKTIRAACPARLSPRTDSYGMARQNSSAALAHCSGTRRSQAAIEAPALQRRAPRRRRSTASGLRDWQVIPPAKRLTRSGAPSSCRRRPASTTSFTALSEVVDIATPLLNAPLQPPRREPLKHWAAVSRANAALLPTGWRRDRPSTA